MLSKTNINKVLPQHKLPPPPPPPPLPPSSSSSPLYAKVDKKLSYIEQLSNELVDTMSAHDRSTQECEQLKINLETRSKEILHKIIQTRSMLSFEQDDDEEEEDEGESGDKDGKSGDDQQHKKVSESEVDIIPELSALIEKNTEMKTELYRRKTQVEERAKERNLLKQKVTTLKNMALEVKQRYDEMEQEQKMLRSKIDRCTSKICIRVHENRLITMLRDSKGKIQKFIQMDVDKENMRDAEEFWNHLNAKYCIDVSTGTGAGK